MHAFTIKCHVMSVQGWLECWGIVLSSKFTIALIGHQMAEI
jgi:hypothetical protein